MQIEDESYVSEISEELIQGTATVLVLWNSHKIGRLHFISKARCFFFFLLYVMGDSHQDMLLSKCNLQHRS